MERGQSALPPPVAVPQPGVAPEAFDHTFTVKDVDGNPHIYHLTFHPPTQGQRIMFQLLAMVSTPGSALAGALLSGESLEDIDLGSINWTGLGAELRDTFASEMTPQLSTQLLSFAVRDNVPLTAGFDMAYKANYGELLGALWEVIRANRFLSLPGMSLDGVLQQVKATVEKIAGQPGKLGGSGPEPSTPD